ncbi:TolC family protein [Flavihumibacter fluvii]|uniref:TolC family protein n=1 Tax=Flavihumibacter fluvii TaxID=2838157 RepID=UPI001BDE75FE|nr:TolC family protein [Flavihumibacter fluvii]ULQ54386.1 TolC family protein [Flavihumibacter fluvii]
MKISLYYRLRIYAFAIIIAAMPGFLMAQTDSAAYLTLQQCVETAFRNNLELKQAEIQAENARIDYKQSKNNLLPGVAGSIEHGLNQGRSIDPFTNSYLNQNINYANWGLNGGIVLFNGLSYQYGVRQQNYARQAANMDVQQNKDNLTINIIVAYLQVLSAEDLLVQITNQAELSKKQVDRLNILNQEGSITPSQLYDLKGQLANDQISLINTKNQLEAAKLSLAQLMNIPYDTGIRLERISTDQFLNVYEGTPESIYQTALNQLAQVKAVNLRKQSAEMGVKAWKGQLWPTFSLNAGLYTNYSNAARTSTLVSSSDQPSSDYVLINSVKEPVYTPVSEYKQNPISYTEQFKNNYSTNVNFSIRIPILNSFQTRNQVSKSRLTLQNADYVEKATKIRLQQAVEQAYLNMNATYNRYRAILTQVDAFQESFLATEARFNEGVLNSVDYLVAKNNVDRASTSLITSKYEYVFRTKILDYYQGKPLW